jgi:hypothetical protein
VGINPKKKCDLTSTDIAAIPEAGICASPGVKVGLLLALLAARGTGSAVGYS